MEWRGCVDMKHYISRVIVACMLVIMLVASGCGSGSTTQSDKGNVDSKEPNATQTTENGEVDSDDIADVSDSDKTDLEDNDENDGLIKIGFAQVGHESDWRTASSASAQDVFSQVNGYELLFADSDNNADEQLSVVRDFIEEKVDYLVIDPILPTGWDVVLEEAKVAGIPVFIIDRTIECDEDLYVAWYGSDFEKEGKAAAEWLKKYIEAKEKSDESLRIVTITGNKGSSAQKGRSKGFTKIAEKQANWELLGEKDGEFTEQGGKKAMEAFLKSYDDIDVVVCQNDNEAWGAMEALDAENISYGVNGKVIIISFDAVRDGLIDVMAGRINADFECNPLAAPYIAEAIQLMEAGGTIENKTNYIDESCFQSDNLVKSIEVDGEKIKMITVNDEVLANRVY